MSWKKYFATGDRKFMNTLTKAGTIGLHFISGTLVGGCIGYFLDEWLGSSPWGLLFFLIVGIIAGFKNVWIDTKRLVAEQDKLDKDERAKKNTPQN